MEENQPKSKRFPIFALIVIVIVALVAFFLGKYTQSGQIVNSQVKSPLPNVQSNLFRSQSATFQGEITKVNTDSLDVKTDSGEIGNFKLSSKVFIYKFKTGATQATSSTDLATIETGKRALIILELSENQYRVVSISYQLPPTTPTPTKKK